MRLSFANPLHPIIDRTSSRLVYLDNATSFVTPSLQLGWDKEKYIAMEKTMWEANSWLWNQGKVEANFAEIDTNEDGVASGLERQAWFKEKAAK